MWLNEGMYIMSMLKIWYGTCNIWLTKQSLPLQKNLSNYHSYLYGPAVCLYVYDISWFYLLFL